MYGNLLRRDLAKMMVDFVVNVLSRTGNFKDESSCLMFNDIGTQSTEMKWYITQACQLGLMGYHPDGVTVKSSFDPNDMVPRAQFGTVLSRYLRWTKYAVSNNQVYYTKHLQALKDAWIMNNLANPNMKELRWRVMLMLERIYDLGN